MLYCDITKQTVTKMIYESSKDYGTGLVTLVYDEDTPSDLDITDYVKGNYGFTPGSVSIDPPSPVTRDGYVNPGIIKCHRTNNYFD